MYLLLIVILYLFYGFIYVLQDKPLPYLYIGSILFFLSKWIFNYRACTISRIECLVRGVKKEEGYIYRGLNNIVDLRYNEYVYIIYILCILLIVYNCKNSVNK